MSEDKKEKVKQQKQQFSAVGFFKDLMAGGVAGGLSKTGMMPSLILC